MAKLAPASIHASPRNISYVSKLTLCVLSTAMIGAGWSISRKTTSWSSSSPVADSGPTFGDDLDARLQQAATDAFARYQEREGTVIVMDPQTGRIRSLVNPKLALEETFAPGSTIKPFVMLAAMRTGLIDDQSRILCRGHYSHKDFHTACSHPQDLPSFKATEAIAYSCNNFFGTVGEQLNESAFDSTLTEFGFGRRTGISDEREAAGRLSSGEWQPKNAMGEGEHVLVTPIQLITAYSALVNGGHLFKPAIAGNHRLGPERRNEITVDHDQRSLLIEGMRGAVRYGTAKRARLDSLPLYIFGKTGTATEIEGFRTQGWFIGFASELAEDSTNESLSAAENIGLAVLVFLKRAHGVEAAELARPIFEEFSRQGRFFTQLPSLDASVSPDLPVSPSTRIPASASRPIRVHLVKENLTRAVSLESYVTGVVASEGAAEEEPEALKALAVACRTYALKNLGRHGAEGYDFCSTTHCQRYRALALDDPTVTPTVLDAVRQTADESLREPDGRLAESYFSASCGGATANINTLWGANAPAYLRGVGDNFCTTMPHARWTDLIPSTNLLSALRSDPRSDMGQRLTNISVTRRDATGRAQLITIEGERRRVVGGWDFKIIIGRALGWHLIKSSRFVVSRSGLNFVFHGSGFGHGLGLCQEGAHVMARRGANYQQILAKYFPGTTVASGNPEAGLADLLWRGGQSYSLPRNHPMPAGSGSYGRHNISSEHFRLTYPAVVGKREAEDLAKTFELSRADLIRRLATAGIQVPLPALDVFLNDTTGNFVGRTGKPSWAAAATRRNQIELQPLALLKRRGILETTVRHELVHVFIDALGRGSTPRWLEEGLALYMAGEGPMLSKYSPAAYKDGEEIEELLKRARTSDEMRTAYAAAYQEVRRLIKNEGEASVWGLVGGRALTKAH